MIIDIKYIQLIRSRLRNFKEVRHGLYNFSCHVCGDSKTHEYKARAYFMLSERNNRFSCYCHKCGYSASLSNFLKTFDANLHKDYVFDRIGGSKRKKPVDDVIIPKDNTEELFRDNKPQPKPQSDFLSKLVSFDNMPIKWKQYLIDRKIPKEHLSKYFYWSDTFKADSNLFRRDSFERKTLKHDEARIIIPFFRVSGGLMAFQGRQTTTDYAKYITIKATENTPKIFGLDRIVKGEKIYVTEGPVDSLFLPCAIGACGSDLINATEIIPKHKKVLVFDNEPRSAIICKKIIDAISLGYEVVIFPNHIEQKDLNDMVLAGYDVVDIVKKNTYSGLMAKMKFGDWKRC